MIKSNEIVTADISILNPLGGTVYLTLIHWLQERLAGIY